MNIVRLGLIIALTLIAAYAISVYAAMPPESVELIQKCETVKQTLNSGAGIVVVAVVALLGAITTSAVDLLRRVY